MALTGITTDSEVTALKKTLKIVLKVVLIIIIVIAAIVTLGAILLYVILPPPLSQKAMERDFMKNKENIMIITTYLVNAKYNEMSIHNSSKSGVMFANTDGYIAVDDPKVVDAMNILLKRKGYKVITKDGNTIHFLRSSTLDFGNGVAYSIDGSEPQLQLLTKLEPLSEPNWYYYEEDFNVWKARNKRAE